ncbi:hypothetical protein Tco_0051941 [Tanacetum coccineum]
MVVRTQPTLSPGLSARLTQVMALSLLSLRKRYKPSCETPITSSSPLVVSPTHPPRKRYHGTSKLIADIDTESEVSEDESTNSKSEKTASGDRQKVLLVGGTTMDEHLGLRYTTARHHALELVEDATCSTFEVGLSSRSIRDQQISNPTPRLPVCPVMCA